MPDLKYKITFAADASGAKTAADVLSSLSSRGGLAQQAFQGVEMAARGNTNALFGLAKAAQALWTVFANATPVLRALTLVAVAISLAGKAWDDYKGRQKEAAEASAEAAEKLAAAQQRLHDVIAASRQVNYDPQVKQLQEIAAAFDQAEAAAKSFKDAQDSIAASQTTTGLAAITESEQRALGAAAGDPAKQAQISLNAKREKAGRQYQADIAGTNTTEAALSATLARIKEARNALAMQDIEEMFQSTNKVQGAEASISRIRKDQQKFGITPESTTKLAEAVAERDRLQADSTSSAGERKAKQAALEAQQSAAQQKLETLPAQRQAITAQYSAQEAADFAAEKTRVAAEDKLRAEKEILETKKQIRTQAEAEAEAVKNSTASRDEELQDEIAMTQIEQERASALAASLQARLLSPAAGRAQDKAERAAQRQEDRVNDRIAAAEDAQKRGARGKWIDDALTLRGARAEAAAKRGELNNLEQQRTIAAAESAKSLKNIEQKLLANLQIGGAAA